MRNGDKVARFLYFFIHFDEKRNRRQGFLRDLDYGGFFVGFSRFVSGQGRRIAGKAERAAVKLMKFQGDFASMIPGFLVPGFMCRRSVIINDYEAEIYERKKQRQS